MNIQYKLILIVSIFTLFIVATVATSFYTLDERKFEISMVSVVTRQLLLIAKVENETQIFASQIKSTLSAEQLRKQLVENVELLEQNSNILVNQVDQQNLFFSLSDEDFRQHLSRVQKIWTLASRNFKVILDPQTDVNSNSFHDAINHLNGLWQTMMSELTQSAIRLEQLSYQKILDLKKILWVILLCSLLTTFLLLFLSRQYITLPIQIMLKNLHELSRPENLDSDRTLPDFGRTEMGKIAKYINKMRRNIYQARQTLQASNQEALRINQALENAATSILIANTDYHIIYVNHSARKLFDQIGPYLQEEFPQFEVQNLLGTSIEVLPTHSRKLLEHSYPSNLFKY